MGKVILGALVLCALLGCDDEAGTDGPDAASGAEAGVDRGPLPDGDPPDTGPQTDAGPLSDTGAADTGPTADAGPTPDAGSSAAATENILLVIADDLGIDHAECYPEAGGALAPTPTIRALCERGIVFDAAWAMPVCSPTRAATLTGTYPFRTGIYGPIGRDEPGLDPDALTLPLALRAGGSPMASGLFGKWHLSGAENNAETHPNDAGFERYAGFTSGAVPDYTLWRRTADGQTARSMVYTSTAFVDDALDWITTRETPWFAMVAFNAPHSPLHLPPADLHGFDDLDGSEADIDARPDAYYRASIEAMDTELGRLLAGIDPDELERTTIIYYGDNGTPGNVLQPPYSDGQSKDSLYEGGIRVPFVVAGAAVRDGGRRVAHPVDVTDVFSTILELAGVEPPAVDGVSFASYLASPDAAPVRDWVFAQRGPGRGLETIGSAVRDDAYKLVREADGSAQFYHLAADPFEADDLLPGGLTADEQARYDALDALIDTVLDSRLE